MDLFAFTDAMFGPVAEFRLIPDSIKKKHYFMMMRFLSIKHPLEANAFNLITINQVNVLNYFNVIMNRQYKVTPNWIRTPTNKSTKTKIKDFDKEVLEAYMRAKGMCRKDFNFYRELFPDESDAELSRLDKIISEK